MRSLLLSLGLLSATNPLSAAAAAGTVDIEWVEVDDLGNPADPATGHGSVDYSYRIGKYMVTLGEYAAFLNSAAASDPYGLYDRSMRTDLNVAGIERSGDRGNYSYSVIGSPNRPVTYVNWFDAARMANWIHNGQGAGSTETGAYSLNGATNGFFSRQPGAQVFIPSEDEWYKAAYYSGTGSDYWRYATQSDSLPGNIRGSRRTNQLNYVFTGAAGQIFSVTQSTEYSSTQNYLTDVGAFRSSASHYGTFDQGGNAMEWTNTYTSINGGQLVVRGGAWSLLAEGIDSSRRDTLGPTAETNYIGFRFASIPEPSNVVLVTLSLLTVALGRHRAPGTRP